MLCDSLSALIIFTIPVNLFLTCSGDKVRPINIARTVQDDQTHGLLTSVLRCTVID